jgi:3-oxoacyl-[acyl-carrier protein] reductase
MTSGLFNLTGKVAIVTGGNGGIGLGMARGLADAGASIAVVGRNEAKSQAAVADLKARGVKALAVSADVTDKAAVADMVARVSRELERIDILVNNAGINTLAHRVTLDEFPREEWDRILAVDLTGLYEVSKAAARIMRAQGSGRIINIASIAGLVPLRLQCAYVAAKAGVVNLTRAMALELAPYGILVNGIAPGSILTDGTRRLFYAEDGSFHAHAQRMLDHVPLGRPGLPEEIAVAVLFLADPENSYTNGHILTVDGGWTAGYTRDF